MWFGREPVMVTADEALPGRDTTMPVPDAHLALGNPLTPPWPDGHRTLLLAMGCFWGAERVFWQVPGVWTTAVGYAGGFTPNPTYDETCTGRTGHTEAVLVVFDPAVVATADLVALFWESHDPTQGMRQGNDVGTQYRSALWWDGDDQRVVIERSADVFGQRLTAAGMRHITTEMGPAPTFYYAEPYHQQYLVSHPGGYCGLGDTGVTCPVGLFTD
jgi:peptide-methionine (S)-S-oxide reductase